MNAASSENARTLASMLRIGEETAAQFLDVGIRLTFDRADAGSVFLAEQTIQLLGLTVARCGGEIADPVAGEIVIRGAAPRTTGIPRVWVDFDAGRAIISRSATARLGGNDPHEALSVVAACYVAAAALKVLVGPDIPQPMPDPLEVDIAGFGVTRDLSSGVIDIGRTYLAGAGAVGNGFLWALRFFRARGRLDVVDYDTVDAGNLQRQVWFRDDDVGLLKAERLVANAQPAFPSVLLAPRQARLQELPERSTGAWLERLVVAVDSPRARRSLQDEVPGAVFDASTTDVTEVVFHFHEQPTENACLSCVYPPDPAELAREREIARHLGVSVADVQRLAVDHDVAERIAARFVNLGITAGAIVGKSYDSLFKALCGQAALTSPDGKQVFAPFAFVSVLAGTILAIEFVRRLAIGDVEDGFNYWTVSPWSPPVFRRRRMIARRPDCPFCGVATLREVAAKLWPRRGT